MKVKYLIQDHSDIDLHGVNMSGDPVKKPSKGLKEKQQTAIYARIKYRQRRIQTFKTHLQKGTFPPRMKSIKPIPKMNTPESQRIVTAACEQAQRVLLDQMLIEEEKKLTRDEGLLQRKQRKRSKPSMAQVLKDLVELQEKYHQACQALELTQQKGLTTSEVPQVTQDQPPTNSL